MSKPTGWFETCNIAYPRALLERLGGFDEAFGFGGEDTDLAWRAIEAGASPRFVDEARVWHAVMSARPPGRASRRDALERPAAVLARHRGCASAALPRHFWLPSHERWLLALGARRRSRPSPAAARSRALGSRVLPYLDLHG